MRLDTTIEGAAATRESRQWMFSSGLECLRVTPFIVIDHACGICSIALHLDWRHLIERLVVQPLSLHNRTR